MTTSIDTETTTQFISMRLASYGNLPFQILSPTPYPDKIGIRLSPDDYYCIVQAAPFLSWLETKRPSLDKLRQTLETKRRQAATHRIF